MCYCDSSISSSMKRNLSIKNENWDRYVWMTPTPKNTHKKQWDYRKIEKDVCYHFMSDGNQQ